MVKIAESGGWRARRNGTAHKPLRFEVTDEELERIAEIRRQPLGAAGLVRLLARSPSMIPEAARVAARGARDALTGGVFWSLVDVERARLAVPDAASGVGWHPPEDLLANLLPMLRPDKHVLELGAGAGRVARLIAERVGSVTCSDVSRPLLAEARRNLSAHANVRFHWSNGFTLAGLEDGSFDVVFAAGMFGYVESRQALALFAEIHRVLRPGGKLVFNQALFDDPAEVQRMVSVARAAGPRAWAPGCEERPYSLVQIQAWMQAVELELESPRVGETMPPGGRAVLVATAR
jgi:SAM-dependent methyltransferase